MKNVVVLVAVCLLGACTQAPTDAPRPLIVVWEATPFSDTEVVKTPKLAIYEDGSLIARADSWRGVSHYSKGVLSESQRQSLAAAASSYFGASEYQSHFDLVNATDHATSAIVLFHDKSAVASTIYGAGIYSIIDFGDRIDFSPEVVGLPDSLCRLLAELHFAHCAGISRWQNPPRDIEGVPIFPSSRPLTGDVIVPTRSAHDTYPPKG